jgi:hypothetical protein
LTAAVRTDLDTGRKIFTTRTAKASDKIAGHGYSSVADKMPTALPPAPAGAVFDAEGRPLPQAKTSSANARLG